MTGGGAGRMGMGFDVGTKSVATRVTAGVGCVWWVSW